MTKTSGMPKQIGHYRVLKRLGEGGYGWVYEAYDSKYRRKVAIKVLKKQSNSDQKEKERFKREADALHQLKQLNHPNIVTIYDTQINQDESYIVMEFVNGETLSEYLAGVPLALPQALSILEQVASALDAAHDQGMAHRDIKPSNILISHNKMVKLTDFGLVKAFQKKQHSLTTTGMIIGTAAYMAPEQIEISRKHLIGPRTDIYALGIVAYEMLTGQVPFDAPDPMAILFAHLKEPLPSPQKIHPFVPTAVTAILETALAKEPNDRYSSASQFVQALGQATQPTTSQKSSDPTRRWDPTTPPTPAPQIPTSQPNPANKLAIFGLLFLVALLLTGVFLAIMNQALKAEEATVTPPPFTGVEATTTLTPDAADLPDAQTTDTLNMRQAPSLDALILGTYPPKTALRLLARNENNSWFQVQAPDEQTGWMSSEFLEINIPIDNLPIVTAHSPTASPIIAGSPTVPITAPQNPANTGILLEVPTGDFLMGSDNHTPEEAPAHTIFLDPFWIDQTEVTNEQYAACVNADACAPPTAPADAQFPNPFGDPQYNSHPVVYVSWHDANTYCTWAGKRLPTEAEWEKAARGTDARQYPWGNQIENGYLNLSDINSPRDGDPNFDDGYSTTAPVGSFPTGASPYGAQDMAGNVWEWVADVYNPNYYATSPSTNPTGPTGDGLRIRRGGSWFLGHQHARTTVRSKMTPENRDSATGFRCAASNP